MNAVAGDENAAALRFQLFTGHGMLEARGNAQVVLIGTAAPPAGDEAISTSARDESVQENPM